MWILKQLKQNRTELVVSINVMASTVWRFSHTVVVVVLNTKSGPLLLTGHIPIYVGTVCYSHIQVFDLWVEDSFDSAAPSYSHQGVAPGKLSMQFRRCQMVRARADHWSHYSTCILLSWCCEVALLLPSRLAVRMLIHPTMVQCTP